MKKTIFALGFFDGVHLGHQALLAQCAALARKIGGESAAITFRRHPQSLFTPTPPALINTTEDRVALLRQYGMTQVRIFPVTEEVMSTPWQAFLQALMDNGAAGFVCGADFRFGARGAGTAERLQAFCQARGLPCAIVADQTLEGTRISSTHIRDLLERGQTEEATRFLGHPHILSGEVVPGRKLGRTIGIPTANLRIPEGVLVPKFGVYACKARVQEQEYLAVTNIGTRPTVSGSHITVEPWLLDFDGDLYGQTITLEFHAFLRPEQKFDSLEALKAQIQQDAATVRTRLG